ncbi:glycosyltransferase family 4 protein [Gramella sp. MAR_2010_147]|uniref:glycosyltransferase family 4 protein n=1 Tax=Gramella sp. MAR_2010_147 TaxID=1250205 RepID=UPI00087CB2F5|nr:glycosyltransferase family 4 protein [Gramella sp. MAR_2010_147]SDR70095.1 Glycosyltransferase involved in cell wall bisynthesis [Gramella sp. MAR_2010_147]
MQKLIRITTIPLSLEKLLEGQLTFMNKHYEVVAVSAEQDRLEIYGKENQVQTFWVGLTRAITPFQDLKALLRLYNYFKKVNPLIVHTHTPKAGTIGMLAGKLAGVPIRLHTVAGLPLMETRGVKRVILDMVEKITYACASKVYPNSYELKEIILDFGYTDENKLKVLGEGSSNGIDTLYFDPDSYSAEDKISLKKQLKIPDSDFIYVYVGRLVSEKGINELVTSFINLEKTNKNISLLLVGPLEDDLDPLDPKVVHYINSNEKIFTTGYKVDVRPYFALSNILVFPSYREGFPNVVMQANAMSIPAIVSDINGCNEIVEDGKNGIIIPVKNHEALEVSMRKVFEDDVFLSRLSQNARGLIQKKYERKQFWEILLKEYKELEALNKHD